METNSENSIARLRLLAVTTFVLLLASTTVSAQCATSGNPTTSSNTRSAGAPDATQRLDLISKIKIRRGGFFLDHSQALRRGRREMMLSRPPFSAIVLGSGDANDFLVFNAGGSERARLTTSGNFGIGTTNPPYRLSVTDSTTGGAVYAETGRTTGSNYGVQGGATGSGGDLNVGGYFFASGTNTPSRAIFIPPGYPAAGDNNFSIYSQSAAKSYFAGNVGIGTTSASSMLDIVGGEFRFSSQTASARSMGILYTSEGGPVTLSSSYTGAGSYQPLSFVTSGAERMRIDSGGNVGIGTTSPPYRLSITDSTTGGAVYAETGRTSGSNYGVQGGATGSGGDLNVGGYFFASGTNTPSRAIFIPPGYPAAGDNNFSIYSQSAAKSYFAGDVAIGTTSPGSYKLNVNGDTNVSGNLNIAANGSSPGNIVAAGTIYAKYQDVAEWVPSSEQLTAGTVVVLDSTKSNQVIASTVGYDTRVAGVISAQPGIALGEKGEGKVLVATTGRVKIKVDATKAPIQIGDLLVTSDVPGMAMKSQPILIGNRQIHASGTLIGKALEPLAKGSGEILVLLSLQ